MENKINVTNEFKFKDTFYDKDDCIPLNKYEDLEEKILVVNPILFLKKYQTPENQIWIATGEFELNSYNIGDTIEVISLYDKEKTKFYAKDFIGILK